MQTKSLKFVTSDPFLGALSNITSLTFSDRNPYQKLFINHFAQVCSILADIAHLYPVPFDSSQQHQSFSFFNPNLIITSQQIANYQPQLIKSINLNPQKKRWLFILSSEDYLAQINLGGQTQFQQILQDKLWETTQAGRQPILIAPRKCIQMLNHCSTNFEDAILLSFCAHHYFMQLLLEAEYLFLWNIFSNCLIPRLSNRRPVFFFDKGHMALAIPAILNLGMQYNYNNAPLTYLEQTNTLNSEQLAQLIPQQEATFTPTRKAFFSCATPETVVQQIIAQ